MKDTIYRQDAIDAINSHFGFNIEEEYGSAVQEVINGLPSAQPEGRSGVFIPDITVEMFRNAPLEGVEELMASGEMEDISLPSAQPEKHTEECTEMHACDCVSRQAAIDALDNIRIPRNASWYPYYHQALTAMSNLPSVQPTYTDAEIQKMQDLESAKIEKAYQLGYEEGKKDAQPERKNGEWEEIEVIADAYDISGVKTWASKMKCDQCGFTTIAIEGRFSQYNFCPNCGADMRGEQNDKQASTNND